MRQHPLEMKREDALATTAVDVNACVAAAISLIQESVPQLLLGTAYAHLYAITSHATAESEMPHDSQVILRLLEYVHAVYASTQANPNARQLDSNEYEKLVATIT